MDLVSITIFFGLVFLLFCFDIYFGKKRIQASAERLGYKDIKIKWEPFAPGAFFSRSRIF